MALDKTALSQALRDLMTNAREKSWDTGQVADALAGAIDTYVRSAVVSGVVITLPGGSTQATQTGEVGLR